MKIFNIQLFYCYKELNISILKSILKESGIKYKIQSAQLDESDFPLVKNDVRFYENDFPVLDPLVDITVIHVSELGYPLPSNLNVVALIPGNNKKYSDTKEAVEDALVLLTDRKRAPEFNPVFSEYDLRNNLANVYLIGAGTGFKEMLTLKAHELICQADVVFYDNLVSSEIIDDIKNEKVYVGKKAGNHSLSQSEISHLVYDACFEYKTIVRLKGGDPLIFGHAGEELAFLESHFIDVQIIPGISSAQVAGTISKTPFTLRGISKSVAYCSGHEKTDIQVPDADTIVYFMGAKNLNRIAEELIRHHRPENTPIKIIYNIGEADQEIFDETIESVLVNHRNYKSPVIVIVGEVADKGNWKKAFDEKKRILYTGTHLSNYADKGYVTHHPMIVLSELADKSEIDNAITKLNEYDLVIFTSAHAVKFFFDRILANHFDARLFKDLKIISIGSNTSLKLFEYGIIADYQPVIESSAGIVNLLKSNQVRNKSVLLPRSDKAGSFLPDELNKMGNKVVTLNVYTNNIPDDIQKVNPDSYDQVIFSSPSGVDNFIKIYGRLPLGPQIIPKGDETLKTLIKYGFKPENTIK